jgi:glycosyltransferase involved in cell wall biosynthesis
MIEPVTSALVSVILPAWRDARHAEAALRSVYDQDHEAVEVIAVGHAARHPAANVIRGFLDRKDVRQRLRRIAYIEESGELDVSFAIQRGLQEAHGDYVNVLEPVDAFATSRFSRLLSACAESGSELAFARVEPCADTPSAPVLSLAEAGYVYSIQDDIEFFPTVGYALLRSQCALSTGNLFFSRRLATRVGGFGEHDSLSGWDFVLRCLLVVEPMFVPEPLYYYRLRGPENLSQRTARQGSEMESIVKNYLFLCRNRPVANPFAPSPAWGPFFDSFLQACGYGNYLVKP